MYFYYQNHEEKLKRIVYLGKNLLDINIIGKYKTYSYCYKLNIMYIHMANSILCSVKEETDFTISKSTFPLFCKFIDLEYMVGEILYSSLD